MRRPTLELGFLAGLLTMGCQLLEGEEDKTDDAKDATTGADDTKQDDADADEKKPSANAAGDSVYPPDAVTECPKSLSGKDAVKRVIRKECGAVPVTGTYRVDGGSLTLEAGASLAFADGAEISIGYYEPAKLIVQGTKEEPVVFTSSGDKAPGVWKGLRLYPKAARSSVEGLVVEYAGNKDGAVMIQAPDVVWKNNAVREAKELGLQASKTASFADFSGNRFEKVGSMAMRFEPHVVGGIGDNNTFEADARVHVASGTIDGEANWPALGAAYLFVGRVRVDGKEGRRARLEIAPGTTLLFDGDGHLDVGYYGEAAIVAKGSADAPIRFAGSIREEAGAWEGIGVYGKGEGEFAHAEFAHGGKKEKDGVLLADKSRVSVDNCSFVDNSVGVVFRGKEAEAPSFDNNTFKTTEVAVHTVPTVLGSLGAANAYENDARILVEAGTVDADAEWVPQNGARIELEGTVRIDDATLTLAPGLQLFVADGKEITVGYYKNANLIVKGSEEAPVRIAGLRDDEGTWKSLTLQRNAHGVSIEHLQVANAGGKAGVEFVKGSDGKVDTLSCEKCTGETLVRQDGVEATNVQ